MEHSLEALKKCPSCGSEKQSIVLECVDFTYSKDSFLITQCSSCGLNFTNPRPTEETIGTYYDNPDYVSHTDTSEGLMFKLYRLVKTYALGQKRILLEGFNSEKTILDYGAGTGDFAIELATNGWNVSAFEPDESARKRITNKRESITLVPAISEMNDASVSVISLWHVLEHVHRLEETLSHFNRILSKNGHLVIAVPNHTSYDAKYYAENWAAYDVPRHLYHFNPNSIKPLIDKFGFKLTQVKPMWFDSFYVSLLSEQNTSTNNIIGWVRALTIGLISNLHTVIDKKKGSSIIYIFEKTT